MHAPRRLAVLAVAVFLPCAAQVHAQAAQATDGPSAAPPAADAAQVPPAGRPPRRAGLGARARAPSPDRIGADIGALGGVGGRHTLSGTTSDRRGIGPAAGWIQAEFERISAACGGCREVMT